MQLTWIVVYRLFLCCLLPVGVSVGFHILRKFTKFGKLDDKIQQIIIGVVFGGVAIFGTEVGVDVGGAIANVRDAGPLCAGLLFGGPAGLIAGFIGGIERYFAVYWGAGDYTVLACSISTILAGVYAYVLRKYMFENKRPNWGFGLAIGMIMEVVHLVILFLTKIDNLDKTFSIINVVSIPMIFANGIAVGLSCLIIDLISKSVAVKKRNRHLTTKIQTSLLISVVVAFIFTTIFMFVALTNTAYNNNDKLLTQNISDIENDVKDSTTTDLTKLAEKAKAKYLEIRTNEIIFTSDLLRNLCLEIGVDEINIVSNDNLEHNTIIKYSSVDEFVGFDMATNPQANEFNVLLNENSEEIFIQDARYNPKDEIYKYAGIFVDSNTYIQVGYEYDKYKDTISEKVHALSNKRHVGTDGFIVIADNNKKIVSGETIEENNGHLSDLGIDVDNLEENKYYVSDIILGYDEMGSAMFKYSKVEYFYIIAIIPMAEVMSERNNMIYITSFMEVIIFAILFSIVYMICKRQVVDKVDEINTDLVAITNGNLDTVVGVTGTKEFNSLSSGINETVGALKKYIEAEAHRIDEELKFAKTIQFSVLPDVTSVVSGIENIIMFAKMFTAKEVGGDFYDCYIIDNNRIGFLIADVSGKGIPAAMFMMQSKAMIKNYALLYKHTNEILAHANVDLCKDNDAEMFVTCWFGILELDSGNLYFTSAGHNPPLHYSKKANTWEYLRTKSGLVLAGIEFSKYLENVIELKPGDKLFLYTDGVTEATNANNMLYGEDRLLDYLNKVKEEDIKDTLDGLKDDIDLFVGDSPQFDDITMLILEYKK